LLLVSEGQGQSTGEDPLAVTGPAVVAVAVAVAVVVVVVVEIVLEWCGGVV
jgi:hypothetical protein